MELGPIELIIPTPASLWGPKYPAKPGEKYQFSANGSPCSPAWLKYCPSVSGPAWPLGHDYLGFGC